MLRPQILAALVGGLLLLLLDRPVAAALAWALAAAQVVLPMIAPRASVRIGRAVGSVGRAAADVLATVVWIPVAVGFVAAWALSPILRTDPLRRRTRIGWDRAAPVPADVRAAASSWSAHDRPGTTAAERTGRMIRRGVALALVAALVFVVVRDRTAGSPPASRGGTPIAAPGEPQAPGIVPNPVEPPYALRDQEAIDQTRQEEGGLFFQIESDPVAGWRFPATFSGKQVSVTDHHRASVQAAEGGPVVWFMGGSTTFGSNQRDAHTIPSEFARAAAADGHPVQVVNWGVHAYTAYQEAEVLQAAVRELGPPDLVVFYDGYNDISVAIGSTFLGYPAGEPQRAPSLAQGGAPSPAPPGKGVPTWLTPQERYEAVIEVQRKAAALADEALAGTGTPVLHFWQPNAFTRIPTDEEREQLRSLGIDDESLATFQEIQAGVRARLPEGFIDLGDVLDDAPTVYADQVHTNEIGARMVAEAMYEAARPAIRDLGP